MSDVNDWLDQTSRQEAAAGAPRDSTSNDSEVVNWLNRTDEKARLGLAVNEGFKRDAGRSSRVLKLQAKTGLPEDLIDRNLDDIESRARSADFDPEKFTRDSPIVAQWMAENPNHVAVAKEDVTKLNYLERQMKHISQQFEMGQRTTDLAKIGESAYLGNITPEQRKRQADLEAQMSEPTDYGITGFWEGVPGAVANQLPIFGKMIEGQVKGVAVGAAGGATTALVAGQLGPQVALPEEIATVPAGAIAGGFLGWRYGAAVEAARLEASLAYLDFEKIKDEDGVPLSRGAALSGATVVGAINGGLEMVGLVSIQKAIPGLKNLSRTGIKKAFKNPTVRRALTRYGKSIGMAMAGEGATEFLQEIVKITGQELLQMHQNGELESASSIDILERIFSQENMDAAIESGRMGLQAGGGVAIATGTVEVATDVRRAQKAKRNQQAFMAIGEASKDLKINEMAPEKTQEVLQRISESGNFDTVYTPVDTWQEYWQSKGLDPEEAAVEVLGQDNAAAYTEAVQTGGDLAIPMSQYAAKLAGSEHHEFFQNEIKSDPLDMNGREADEFINEMDRQDAQKVEQMQQTEQEQQVETETDQIQNQFVEQLQQTGMDEATAQNNAQLISQGLTTLAERAGVTPAKLAERFGLQVARPELETEVAEGERSFNQATPEELESLGYTDEFDYDDLNDAVDHFNLMANRNMESFQDPEESGFELKDPSELLPEKGFQGEVGWLKSIPRDQWVSEFARVYDRDISQILAAKDSGQLAPVISINEELADGYARTKLAHALGEKIPVSMFTAESQLNQDKRGRIVFNDQRQFRIELLKNADLSTFLHETGHFYLEVLGDLATQENANPEIVKDYESVLEWMGVKSRDQIGTEQHEKWARGFEAYLMEGKAPSIALRNAFAKFRAWLSSIYKKMSNLNVELTDDVRGVMDRMLATQEELEAVRQEQNLSPLFADLANSGMNEQQALDYSQSIMAAQNAALEEMTSKHMEQIQREELKWWKQESRKVRDEVEQQIDQERVYIALANMQRGKLPNGDPLPEGMDQVKLNRDALIQDYDADFIKNRLPKPFVYSREGGIHHDLAAQLFGFESGDTMIIEIANATPRKQEIKNRVDQIMKERHGDLMTDGTARAEAMKVIHNDKTAQLMRKELEYLVSEDFAKFKGLQRKIARPVPKVDFVRDQAETIIAQKKIRDIKPIVYQRAESKASREAQEAFLKGDFKAAFDAKQRQLLNHELYRAANNARDSVEKSVNFMSRFQEKSTRQRIGKAGGSYLEQIDAIMDRFSFRKGVSLKSLDKQQSLLQWVQEQNDLGFTVDVPEKLLNEAVRTNYMEMTLDELNGVTDTVKNISHLARTKNKLLANKKARDMQAAEDEIVASITAHHKLRKDPPNFSPDFSDKFKEGLTGFFATHTKMEFLFEHLDGEKANGSVWQYLFKPFVDAENAENTMMRDVSVNMREIFSAYTQKERADWLIKKQYIPEIGNSLNKANMMAVALNWGNEYNRAALMEGEGWSESQVNAILSRLEKKDFETVQKIWDFIDTFWPAVEAQEKELNGIAPPKVQAAEVETQFGTFKGGYYPIVFDSKRSWRQAALEEAANVKEMFGGNFAKAMTKNGHTKERTNTGGKPLNLELSGLTEHVSAVVHDLTHRKAVIDVSRIVSRKGVREAIEQSVGREMYAQINPWLTAIASERRTEPSHKVEKLLGRARMGATVVNMGLKFTTAIVQFTGYAVSAKELGSKYAFQGLNEMKNPTKMKENYNFISERSEMMRDRLGNFDRDIRDSLKKLNVSGVSPGVIASVATKYGFDKVALTASLTDNYYGEVRDSYFSLIAYMDLAVAMPTWLGAYRKALDGAVENVESGNEADAIAYADRVVRVTQGAGGPKDLARVQRGSEAFKLFTMFYSYFSVLFNQFQKTTNQFKMDRNIPKLVSSMFLLWFFPAVIEDLILGRGPDEDADQEEWTKWFLKKEITYPFQGVILMRDVVNGMGEYGFNPSAAFAPMEYLARTGKTGVNIITGEKDEIERKDIKSVFMTTGYLTGLPSRQVWLSSEYLYDWMNGDENPDSPVEGVWRTLVTGKPRE